MVKPTRVTNSIRQLRFGAGEMTQADLADMLGITRQSLNVELKRLERKGMVGLGRGRIDIQDQAQLAQLANDLE